MKENVSNKNEKKRSTIAGNNALCDLGVFSPLYGSNFEQFLKYLSKENWTDGLLLYQQKKQT